MRFRYQFVYFAELGALTPQSSAVLEVFQRLSRMPLGLVPSTFGEITPPKMTPEPRMRFAAPSGEWEVNVPRARLDVFQTFPAVSGDGLGGIESFIEHAQGCLDAVLGSREIHAHRFALVVTLLNTELPDGKEDALYKKLLSPPPMMAGKNAPEWSFRSNIQVPLEFAGMTETVNAILKVDRGHGEIGSAFGGQVTSFEGVITEVDINTLVTETTPRLARSAASSFMTSAAALFSQLENEVNELLA